MGENIFGAGQLMFSIGGSEFMPLGETQSLSFSDEDLRENKIEPSHDKWNIPPMSFSCEIEGGHGLIDELFKEPTPKDDDAKVLIDIHPVRLPRKVKKVTKARHNRNSKARRLFYRYYRHNHLLGYGSMEWREGKDYILNLNGRLKHDKL